MNIPILWQHNANKPIGEVICADGKVHFKFNDDVQVTQQMMFDIFGNAGFTVTEGKIVDGTCVLIRAGCIVEWSMP